MENGMSSRWDAASDDGFDVRLIASGVAAVLDLVAHRANQAANGEVHPERQPRSTALPS